MFFGGSYTKLDNTTDEIGYTDLSSNESAEFTFTFNPSDATVVVDNIQPYFKYYDTRINLTFAKVETPEEPPVQDPAVIDVAQVEELIFELQKNSGNIDDEGYYINEDGVFTYKEIEDSFISFKLIMTVKGNEVTLTISAVDHTDESKENLSFSIGIEYPQELQFSTNKTYYIRKDSENIYHVCSNKDMTNEVH